jgi:hypothetical protein
MAGQNGRPASQSQGQHTLFFSRKTTVTPPWLIMAAPPRYILSCTLAALLCPDLPRLPDASRPEASRLEAMPTTRRLHAAREPVRPGHDAGAGGEGGERLGGQVLTAGGEAGGDRGPGGGEGDVAEVCGPAAGPGGLQGGGDWADAGVGGADGDLRTRAGPGAQLGA